MFFMLFQKRKDLWMMLHYWQQQETTVLYYNTEIITKQAQVKKFKRKQNREETEEQIQQKAEKEELECANKQKNNQLMCTKIRNIFENILMKQNDTFQQRWLLKSLTLFQRTPLSNYKRISNNSEHSSMKKCKHFQTSKRKTMFCCK